MRVQAALTCAILLTLCMLGNGEHVEMGSDDGDKMPLSGVTSLQFSSSKFAVMQNGGRRAELNCVSGSASGFWWHPDWYPRVISCVRFGMNEHRQPLGAEWRCSAKLRANLELGETRVLCERYDGDPHFIVSGSCRLEYTLNFIDFKFHFVHVLYGSGLTTALFLMYALVRFRSLMAFPSIKSSKH